MPVVKMVEYEDAGPEVRAVYDDIMESRNVRRITNFWKTLAHDPALLQRTWEMVKAATEPGALDALTKELIYIAVSATNGCEYCVTSHTAGARRVGMTEEMFAELMGVVAAANATNRLANGYLIETDEALRYAARGEKPPKPKGAGKKRR